MPPLRREDALSAARFLEPAPLFNFIIHCLAMVSMALLLLPGMPGGSTPSEASRVAYIAHPWVWRLGRFPWQVTALADLALGIPLGSCQPMSGRVESKAAAVIAGNAEPICFRVPTVKFLFNREWYDRPESGMIEHPESRKVSEIECQTES